MINRIFEPYYKSTLNDYTLYLGDVFQVLPALDYEFDMIFADPPYFLSNDGLTFNNGKVTSVNKGEWDRAKSFDYVNQFNRKWLSLVKDKMKNNATIWISGTMHNIFSIGLILQQLGFKIINVITWQKTNPPPNFSHRSFTHSTEFIIWAKKTKSSRHYFDYELMVKMNQGKQMRDVWLLPAISKWEKDCGKHPTQKPLPLLSRIILASTKQGDLVLDPFAGSCTTGIAANLYNRKFVGIDINEKYLQIGKCRRQMLNKKRTFWQEKVEKLLYR